MIIPAGIPIICGLFYKHTPWWAAIASYGTALAIGIVILATHYPISFEMQIFGVGGIGAAIYFLPGLFIQAKGKYKEKLEAFFRKVETPVQPSEVGDSTYTDAGSIRITGWTTVAMGLAAMTLALLPLDLVGRAINFMIAGLMACMGAFVLLAAKYIQHYKKKQAAGRALSVDRQKLD